MRNESRNSDEYEQTGVDERRSPNSPTFFHFHRQLNAKWEDINDKHATKARAVPKNVANFVVKNGENQRCLSLNNQSSNKSKFELQGI